MKKKSNLNLVTEGQSIYYTEKQEWADLKGYKQGYN